MPRRHHNVAPLPRGRHRQAKRGFSFALQREFGLGDEEAPSEPTATIHLPTNECLPDGSRPTPKPEVRSGGWERRDVETGIGTRPRRRTARRSETGGTR